MPDNHFTQAVHPPEHGGARWPIVAVDLGGTWIRAARLSGSEAPARAPGAHRPPAAPALLGRRGVPTPASEGPEAVVAAIAELVGAVLRDLPDEDRTAARIVVAATGPVDGAGAWIDPSNLGPRFHGYPLGSRLANLLARPVRVGLDTHLALLGEHRAGALAGCRDAAFVTISTGVGGAILADGRLVTGAHGVAGEIGHLPVEASGPRCGCGGRGHLEAVASGPALVRAAVIAAERSRSVERGHSVGRGRAAGRGGSATLHDRLAAVGAAGLSTADVVAAAAAGDREAAAILARARRAVGRAVTGLVNILDPERVVLGGGVVLADPDPWLEACRAAIAVGGLRTQAETVRVLVADLGDDAGLIGCADHALLGGVWIHPD